MQKCSAFNAMMPTLAIPLAGKCLGASSEVLGFFLVIHVSMVSLEKLPRCLMKLYLLHLRWSGMRGCTAVKCRGYASRISALLKSIVNASFLSGARFIAKDCGELVAQTFHT